MCGRTRCTLRPDDFLRASHLNGRRLRHVDMDRYRPSYNVSPGFNLPVIRREDGQGADGHGQRQDAEQGAVLHCMKWGLIPSFTKKTEKPDHYKMFNARGESIREKASFRRLVPNNRCLVAVEGFYEWKKDGSKRQPYYIHFKDGRPMVFAALFDSWKNSEGYYGYTSIKHLTFVSDKLDTYDIGDCKRDPLYLHYYYNVILIIFDMAPWMPVILGSKESTEMWLNAASSSNFDTILKPYEMDLAWYPVTPAMGKPSFDGPECIKEIQMKINESRPISEFFSKRGTGRQLESILQGGTTKEEATEINTPKMEENVTEDSVNPQTPRNKDKDDTKPEVFEPCHQGGTNISMKREYEAVSGDTEHSDDDAGKQHASPLQKRPKDDSGETAVNQQEETKRPSLDRTYKLGKSPAKKKASGAGDKQPTLFSYFGKG